MRSDSTQKTDKQNELLHAFQTNESLSIADIEELLHCNRMSAHNYLNRLIDTGYTFNKEIKNRKALYSLTNGADVSQYEPITLDTLRKYSILHELENGPIPKTEFKNHFTVENKSDLAGSGLTLIDVETTKYYELINSLQEEGLLILDSTTNTYHLSGNTLPLYLHLDLDALFALNGEMADRAASSPYAKQFHSIMRKTSELLGTYDFDTINSNNYLIYGRTTNGLSNIPKGLQNIFDIDFSNHILSVDYTDKAGKTTPLKIAIGLIIYSLEKDTFYLLCDNVKTPNPTNNSGTVILNAKGIQNVRMEKTIHKKYESAYFLNLFEKMFSISLDRPQNVVVEFQDFGNIRRKLNHLLIQRKNAKLTISPRNTLLYTDTISGLDDFAAYLRGFGSAVKVLKPKSLAKKMQFTTQRTLKRYEEELGHEL